MKKILYIFIAVSAFIAGVFTVYLRPLVLPVRLFDLKEEQYKSQRIKLKGYFEVVKENGIYYYNLYDFRENCSPEKEMCWAMMSLEIPDEIRNQNKLLLNELAEKTSAHIEASQNLSLRDKNRYEHYFADVEIVGDVEEKENNLFHTPMFVIKVEEIKQLSPVKLVSANELNGANYKKILNLE